MNKNKITSHMNKNKITSLALAGMLLGLSASAITITSFGNVAAPTFTSDGFTTFSTVTPGPASIDIAGTDLQVLSGTFSAVDLTSLWGNDLSLSGSAATAPASTFTITLFDAEDDIATFVGGAWSGLSGSGETLLSFSSADGSFNAATVYALELATGGGGDAVAATFTGLSLVPEPSTYAALAGLCALGYVMVRRRRA